MNIVHENEDWWDKFNRLFGPLKEARTKEIEMAAIWLNRPVMCGDGKKYVRIAAGMEVTIIADELVDTVVAPTHRVIGCYGSIDSYTLSMQVINLETNEPLIVKMK